VIAATARYLDLYRHFLAQRLKILLEYRASFLIGAASVIAVQSAGVAAVWSVLRQVPDLNGWKLDEVLLIFGLVLLSESITHMFADNLWTLGWAYVRTGHFDRLLVRPVDPLFHLLADRFCHDGLGDLVIGLALVTRSVAALDLRPGPAALGYLGLSVLSGGAIFVALNLLTATTAFWFRESIPLTRSVYALHDFAKYPLTIFHRSVRVLLTWAIPYGFCSYYPASFLLGRDVGVLAWLGPVVAAALMAGALAFWRLGLRHYQGTGT